MTAGPARLTPLRAVASMTPAQEHQARQRASECADLRWHWDGAYEFGHDGQRYWARRADNGEIITGTGLGHFRDAVRLNYCEHPVPRDPRDRA